MQQLSNIIEDHAARTTQLHFLDELGLCLFHIVQGICDRLVQYRRSYGNVITYIYAITELCHTLFGAKVMQLLELRRSCAKHSHHLVDVYQTIPLQRASYLYYCLRGSQSVFYKSAPWKKKWK